MPIFYEITAPNKQKSYLFGTLHSSDKEINTLPLEVMQAFNTASALYVEVDEHLLQTAQKEVLDDWFSQHGHEHHQWANIPNNVDKVVQQIQDCFPGSKNSHMLIRNYPPLLALAIISQGTGKILDKNLTNLANKRNTPVHFLEQSSKPLSLLIGTQFSYHEQRQLFNILTAIQSRNELELLIKNYLNDKIIFNQETFLNQSNENDRALLCRYLDKIIASRDADMADKLELPFLIGNTFVAVGAAHLSGIVDIFQKKGYSVKNIPITRRLYPVVDYYERNYFNMVYTGAALILAGACLTACLAISQLALMAGLLLIATALATYALVKIEILIYEYITEPQLTINPPATTPEIKLSSARVGIFAQTPHVFLPQPNERMQWCFDSISSHSPCLFLASQGEENIDRIIEHSHFYQLEEAIRERISDKKPMSQLEFDHMFTFKDPRDAFRSTPVPRQNGHG